MSRWLAFAPSVLALSVAGYEWRLTRGNRAVPGLLNLFAFGLCMGAAMTVPAPSAMAGFPCGTDIASSLVYILSRGLRILALFSLTSAALSLGGRAAVTGVDHRPAWRTRTRWGVVQAPDSRATVCAYLVCAALFALAHPHCRGSLLVVRGWQERTALALSDLTYTAYLLWCLTVFLVLIVRHSRRIGSGPVRAGLCLIVLSSAVGVLWALWSVEDPVCALLEGHQDLDEDAVSVLLSTACLTLGALGATATAWWAPTAGPAQWLWTRRTHRALWPLWSALCEAAPEVSLSHFVASTGRRARTGARAGMGLVGNARFDLYRRVIEIRDGCLAMRPHVHPHVPTWVAEHTDDAVVRDAAVLAVALDAVARRTQGASGGRGKAVRLTGAEVSCGVDGSLDAEAAWLARVARAFVRSPVVADCRARAEAERAHPDEPGSAV